MIYQRPAGESTFSIMMYYINEIKMNRMFLINKLSEYTYLNIGRITLTIIPCTFDGRERTERMVEFTTLQTEE